MTSGHRGDEVARRQSRETEIRGAAVFVSVVVFLALVGCQSLRSRPNQTSLDLFGLVDAIKIEGEAGAVPIEDPASIARLREIYGSARWKPYIATLPAHVERITCCRGDEILIELDFVGFLMEGSSDDMWYAELSDEDREWLSQLCGSRRPIFSPKHSAP